MYSFLINLIFAYKKNQKKTNWQQPAVKCRIKHIATVLFLSSTRVQDIIQMFLQDLRKIIFPAF